MLFVFNGLTISDAIKLSNSTKNNLASIECSLRKINEISVLNQPIIVTNKIVRTRNSVDIYIEIQQYFLFIRHNSRTA